VALRTGRFRPGWSRLVMELAGPYGVTTAAMDTAGSAARVDLRLDPVSAQVFAAGVGALNQGDWALPDPAPVAEPKRRQTGDGPLMVVLDPGHGGIDPGAETGGLNEAGLVLTFALELKEALIRAGMRVELTRETDVFVPLETRISVAHAMGADLFLSLHADAIAEGVARGATVYTLADTATDEASATLAERHDRADLLAGVDLSEQDDLVATVLMDMARTETTPRTDRLADALVASIKGAKIAMHKRPRLAAAFSVLKSPDIPSVLLELGFLSSDRDLANLQDPDWRARMVAAIAAALADWAVADAAEALLLRQ
jgi:N-acetylmuramoyl-L-alanine amidase